MLNQTFIAFDTETSGAWPISSEIIEFGGIQFTAEGEIQKEVNFLIKPSRPLQPDNIAIHGITNEMVENAPPMKDVIREIHTFINGGVCIAHHAPFDMGFVALALDDAKLSQPTTDALCSSLLARKLIAESANHKLQTLVKLLKIDGGQAHRASDDAKSCMMVFLECVKRLGPDVSLEKLYEVQEKKLSWMMYSIPTSGDGVLQNLVQAIRNQKIVDMVYEGGTLKEKTRPVLPIGVVRNPDGDYLYATCLIEHTNKRFYISRIRDLAIRF